MIRFQNIKKSFSQKQADVLALNNIDLTIPKGEIFGIIGHSGAGKSTLVRLINALELPTSGSVIIDGHNLTEASPQAVRQQKKKIGMIFQHFNLLENRTVAENVALPLLLEGVKKAERHRIVNELLDYVGLKEKKDAYPHALSGGQKQRVGIARALANQPDILLCDEATSALDPQTTRSILDLLKKINQERKVTVVLVTHEMSVITYVCDSLAVMSGGQVVEHGKTLELFKNPSHQVTREFVNAIINQKLPVTVFKSLQPQEADHLYRLEFLNRNANEQVITRLIRQGQVDVSIIFANMIDIKSEIIGHMFVVLKGNDDAIEDAVTYLKAQGIKTTQIDPKEFQHDD